MHHFAIAVYMVIEKGPSKRMRWRSLAVPFERTATREEVSSVVAERSPHQVCLYDVTVLHKVLPNPETIVEQNRHLITSMYSCAQLASVTMSSTRMQRPFPALLPSTHNGTWSYTIVTAYSRWKLAFEDTRISASCLTAVNPAPLDFCRYKY